MMIATSPVFCDEIRIASYHTGLSRDGPGLLLRDIHRGEDAQIAASIDVIRAADADILVLQDFDYDGRGLALTAFADALEQAGAPYPYLFSLRPNSGRMTEFDLNGNGRSGDAQDAEGYGRFNGQGGMAILSRLPIGEDVRDFSRLLWSEMPEPQVIRLFSPEIAEILPLFSVAAWQVPIILPNGSDLQLLATHATAPVFDGPEDRNGHRNADVLRFWQAYLSGWSPPNMQALTSPQFALIGTLNVDPDQGEGHRDVLRDLLAHPAIQDPIPRSASGIIQTADWPEPEPGNLRVDYILPAADLPVMDHGLIWGEESEDLANAVALASDHRLVWVDIAF